MCAISTLGPLPDWIALLWEILVLAALYIWLQGCTLNQVVVTVTLLTPHILAGPIQHRHLVHLAVTETLLTQHILARLIQHRHQAPRLAEHLGCVPMIPSFSYGTGIPQS